MLDDEEGDDEVLEEVEVNDVMDEETDEVIIHDNINDVLPLLVDREVDELLPATQEVELDDDELCWFHTLLTEADELRMLVVDVYLHIEIILFIALYQTDYFQFDYLEV